jgi:Flagella basal body rod protein
MVNKTFLPPSRDQAKQLTPFNTCNFRLGTAFAVMGANRGLGESSGSLDPRAAWEGSVAHRRRGEPPMENMLLVGLSRQMVLERQMDVVANNVANVNTRPTSRCLPNI